MPFPLNIFTPVSEQFHGSGNVNNAMAENYKLKVIFLMKIPDLIEN